MPGPARARGTPDRVGPQVCGCRAARRAAPHRGSACWRRPMRRARWPIADIVISAVTAAQTGTAAQVGGAAPEAAGLFLRPEFHARRPPKAGGRASSMRRVAASSRPPSCRRSRRAVPHRPCCSAVSTPRRSCRIAQQLGFTGAQRVLREVRRGFGGQDVPQRDRQGTRGTAARIAAHGARTTASSSAVLESLQPLFRWTTGATQARYMISRALVHGRRRAEEMREAARTVTEAGFAPRMSERLRGVAGVGRESFRPPPTQEPHTMLDTLLHAPRGHVMIIDCHGHYTTAPERAPEVPRGATRAHQGFDAARARATADQRR